MVDQTSPSSGREATPAVDQRDDMACGDACRSDHPFGGPEVIGIVEAEKAPCAPPSTSRAPSTSCGCTWRGVGPTLSAGSSFPDADRPVGGERRGGRSVVTAAAE